MTIAIDDDFIAMWYFHPEPKLDWLGGLTRAEPSPQPIHLQMDTVMEMKFVYRFRYYKDDIADSRYSEDEKRWYETKVKETPRKAIENLRQVVGHIAEGWGVEFTEIIMDERGVKGLIEKFKDLPFMHMTEVKEGKA